MSCRVAARFLGRLPVLLAASRGLCRAGINVKQVYVLKRRFETKWESNRCTLSEPAYLWARVASQCCRTVLQRGCRAWFGLMERQTCITVQLRAEHLEGGRAQRPGSGSVQKPCVANVLEIRHGRFPSTCWKTLVNKRMISIVLSWLWFCYSEKQ